MIDNDEWLNDDNDDDGDGSRILARSSQSLIHFASRKAEHFVNECSSAVGPSLDLMYV